jgi:hypothetical protein
VWRGDGGRRYGGGNSEQKIIAETNIHGGDLREIDKKMIGHKKLWRRQTKRDPKNVFFFINSHKIQKVSGFLPKLGRMG